ncbi:MAG TPA: SRPBCC family protein [Pseudonocardiaceae bacterium]|jgi:hypothetical protein|nr:SRPBCC family protein [Pseudonocardiaceae bacterium]
MSNAELVEVEYTFDVPVPPKEAFALISDPRQERVWRAICVEVTPLDEVPRVGSQYEIVFEMFGKRMEFTVQIEEFEPGRSSKFRTLRGSFQYFGAYDYAAHENGTTSVRSTLNVIPGDYFGIMSHNLIYKMLVESIKQDSAKLAARLGTKAPTT